MEGAGIIQLEADLAQEEVNTSASTPEDTARFPHSHEVAV